MTFSAFGNNIFFAMQTQGTKKKVPKELKVVAASVGDLIKMAEKAQAPAAIIDFISRIDVAQTYFDLKGAFEKHGLTGKAVVKALKKSREIGWIITLADTFAGAKMVAAIDDKLAALPPEKISEIEEFFDL